MSDYRIIICVAASIAWHLCARKALSQLPERDPTPPPRRVEVRVVEPPLPPPEPVKPPEPMESPEPVKPPESPAAKPPKVVEHPVVRPTPRPAPAEPPPEQAPPRAESPVAGPTTAPPVFGVTMESTTSSGTGPSVPVGNTASPTGPAKPGAPIGAPPSPAPPVAAHEVTKMPMPRGRCAGTYTDAAKQAAIEGVVVLDLIVDERGRSRDIAVVEGLSHGLTEAAVAALRACRFTPGERGGIAVPVRVRGFKIRFVIDE